MVFQQTVGLDNYKEDVRIVFVGDLHIGLKAFRADLFDKILEELQEPNTLWIGLGDYVEGRSPKHKFYVDTESDMSVQEQYEYFFNKIRPYTKTCLGLHVGNHEAGLINETTVNPLETFCIDNHIAMLDGGDANTIFLRGGESFRLVTLHGAGGGLKVGASVNKVTDYLMTFNGDAICCGHFHKMNYNIGMKYVEPKDHKGYFKPTPVILNGSCLMSYRRGGASYAEVKMMPPTAMGYSILWLDENLKPDVSLVFFER